MGQYIQYKNAKVHFSDTGSGKAVVLLHGFLLNMTMWNTLKATLKEKNRVVTIDLLGHGKTESISEVHTMEAMAEAVNAVLHHLKIKRSILIGHSMGGYVALAYAEKNPQTLEGLCLANSTAKADDFEKRKNRDRAILAVRMKQKTFIRLSIPNLFRPKNRRIFSKEINRLKKLGFKIQEQGITASLEGMKVRKNREELFRSLPINKMLIIGKKDPILDYNSLMEQIKNSDIKSIELADGHMSYIENKKEFTYSIMHFIENI